MPIIVTIIAYVCGSSDHPALLYLMVICYPLQGVYNLAIYIHPIILNAKKKSKGDNFITWWRAFVMALWFKGRDKKKRGGRNARDPPTSTSTLHTNINNRESNKGRTFSPQVDQNSNHLSFGRIRTTSLSCSASLPIPKVWKYYRSAQLNSFF